MKRAFTLIELLVVIAIIAILAAILFPVFAQAKVAAKKATAVSNMKQTGLALVMYAGDVDDTTPFLYAQSPGLNGGTNVNTPFESQLYPYTKNYDIFHSAADSNAITGSQDAAAIHDGSLTKKKRSFGYPVALATQEQFLKDGTTTDPNTGLSTSTQARSMTSMSDPANTVAFVEAWPAGNGSIGWSMANPDGSAFSECDLWKLAGRKVGSTAPGDAISDGCKAFLTYKPTTGYNDQTAYSFTDGHAKAMGWGQIRKNDFAAFKIVKPDTTFNP